MVNAMRLSHDRAFPNGAQWLDGKAWPRRVDEVNS